MGIAQDPDMPGYAEFEKEAWAFKVGCIPFSDERCVPLRGLARGALFQRCMATIRSGYDSVRSSSRRNRVPVAIHNNRSLRVDMLAR